MKRALVVGIKSPARSPSELETPREDAGAAARARVAQANRPGEGDEGIQNRQKG